VRLARSTFSAALASVLVVLAIAPAPASARPPKARAATSGAMVEKINAVRARHGLRPLRSSPALSGTSERFAAQLMRADILQHRAEPSTGAAFGQAGEVLALQLGHRARPGAAIAQWMQSGSHRAVLLTRSMNQVGAGFAVGSFRGRPAVIWVAQVGRR
jgi:uncharacterized protein YkwD